jgi:hypothetical protein
MKASQSGQDECDSEGVGGADEWPDFAETGTAAVASEIREPTIDELLAGTDVRSRRHDEALAAESDFTDTANLDLTEDLLAPEEMFSSEDLEGKI